MTTSIAKEACVVTEADYTEEPIRQEVLHPHGMEPHESHLHAMADQHQAVQGIGLLLPVSRLIDGITDRVGGATRWLVLVAALISSLNAMYRYVFSDSSNALLELQWYMFGGIFLLCAGYNLKHDAHVRIDIIYGKLSKRTQTWIDIFGTVLFLLPVSILITWLSWTMFMNSFHQNEMSSDAGGLLRWPIKFAIPLGFALLSVQGISELIKKIAGLKVEEPTNDVKGVK